MDAWATLIVGSTIAEGDAWERLQAQGGGGGPTIIVLADGLGVDVMDETIVVAIDTGSVAVAVDDNEIAVSVDQSPLEIEA